jgi:hypothetical protein
MKKILELIRIYLFGREKTLGKTIVNWAFILLLIAGFAEYGIDHNGDMSGLLKKETWKTDSNNYQDNLPKSKQFEGVNDTIYIKSLGNVKSTTLSKAAKILENKFNVKTKIDGYIELTDGMLDNDNRFDMDIIKDYIISDVKTLVVTNFPIINYVDGEIVKNDGFQYGQSMLVTTLSYSFEQTVIHEYGHLIKLDHCQNDRCVMSLYKKIANEVRTPFFCENCKNKINL